jgi:hypothetical protein
MSTILGIGYRDCNRKALSKWYSLDCDSDADTDARVSLHDLFLVLNVPDFVIPLILMINLKWIYKTISPAVMLSALAKHLSGKTSPLRTAQILRSLHSWNQAALSE